MENSKSGEKAKWSKETLHIFCDICIRAIDMGMRPGLHFEKGGWKYIVKSFGEKTGKLLQKDQLKNKWDENRGVSKFRQTGIEPSLKFKFDRMFSRVTATGQYAWAPSSGTLPASDDDLETLNVGLQGADLEEGSGDSDENVDTDLQNYHARGFGGEHISSSSNTKSSGKRKEREQLEPRARKKKSSSIGAQLVSIQQQLLDSMSSRSDSTSANKDLPGCSIPERAKIEKCGLAS
ncbi:L10-interacting MYB domain-containing protein [Salix suchowensis]|nr:L10-interacting MYB domain-containing protein [Salix suchowensis]